MSYSDIRTKIQEWGRGRIFFAEDFTMVTTPGTVRIALMELSREGFIYRLARGIYCYPALTGDEFETWPILPSSDTIAQAVAQREKCHILPCGQQAAFLCGFTTLQMSRNTYLTDGSPRSIGLGKLGRLTFTHSSEVKIFSFRNREMQLLSLALRTIGKDAVTPEIRARMADILTSVPKAEFEHDIKLCPVWVSELMFDV